MEATELQESSVYTSDEAAKYLRISKVTLYKLLKEGKIRSNKTGKNYRILKSELDSFLIGPAQEPPRQDRVA